MPTFNNKRGFTLLEIIISVSISAVILVGLYNAFDNIFNSQTKLDATNSKIILQSKLSSLFSNDFEASKPVLDFAPENSNKDYLCYFITYNSLPLNKSTPVIVSYYVESEVLYRQEINYDIDFEFTIPILNNVTEYQVKSFDNSTFRDGFLPATSLVKLSLTAGDIDYSFTLGKLVQL